MDWITFLAKQIEVTPEELDEIIKVTELKTIVNLQLRKPLSSHLFRRLIRVVYMLNGEYLPEKKIFKIPRQRRANWEEVTEMLTEAIPNEVKEKTIIELLVKPLSFLEPEPFKKLAKKIEEVGGVYISGKSKCFRILIDPPCKTPQERLLFQLKHQNLTAYEISVRLNKLVNTYKLSQEQIASQIQRSRSWVANHIRIIQLKKVLPPKILKNISEGVARVLLSTPDLEKSAAEYMALIENGVTPTMKILQEKFNTFKSRYNIKEGRQP